MSRMSLSAALTLLLLLPGCFENPFPAGQRQPGRVDARFVGDWTLEQSDDKGEPQTTRLVIRNVHNDEYYVEWQAEGEKPLRMTGWLNDVGGAQFASLLPITEGGEIADKYTIIRVVWAESGFELHNLDADFFKDKKIDSSAALAAILENNHGNDAMYKGEPLIATREKK